MNNFCLTIAKGRSFGQQSIFNRFTYFDRKRFKILSYFSTIKAFRYSGRLDTPAIGSLEEHMGNQALGNLGTERSLGQSDTQGTGALGHSKHFI